MKRILVLMVLVICLTACGSEIKNPAEQYQKYNAQQIYNAGVKNVRSRHYNDAIDSFEALDALYPFGDYAEKGQLYIIYAYYKAGKNAEGVAAADRYIHLHPSSEHVDYAYYMKAVMNFQQNIGVFERYFPSDISQRDLKPAKQSFIAFSALVKNYPHSKYVPNGLQYMIYLRNLMAEQEVKIADFYLQRKAYVAAANRANDVILHYQGTVAIPEALYIATVSYRALHSDDQASKYYKTLVMNYPNSDYIKKL